MSSFHIDSRVELKLDFDLAVRLGEFILDHSTADKQIQALGHRLVSLDEKASLAVPVRRQGHAIARAEISEERVV